MSTPQTELTVNGRITRPDGAPINGVTVRAFDMDLRHEEPLGERVSGTDGGYRLTYAADQFRRSEKKRADLVVRVFSPLGMQLAESAILFNAPAEARVDLTIAAEYNSRLTEFEAMSAALAPVLDGVEPADLTDRDLDFLVGETGLDRQRLDFLRRSAALDRTTGVPTPAFYAWAREGLPLGLDELLALDSDLPRRALEAAVGQWIVSARLRDQLEVVLRRLDWLRSEHGLVRSYDLRGRLTKRGVALTGLTVWGFDLESGRELGYDVSAGAGRFTLTYAAPRDGPTEHRVRLDVLDSVGKRIHQTNVSVLPGRVGIVEIQVPGEAMPEPISPGIADVAAAQGLDIPGSVLAALMERGVHTLADIRTAGGLGSLDGLPAAPEVLHVLDAHVRLNLISTDLRANSALIERGFTSPAKIAKTERAEFVISARQALGDFKAAQLYSVSRGVVNLLDGAVMEVKSAKSNGYEFQDSNVQAIAPQIAVPRCTCEDCEAALSPLAYLADLLDYAISHVKNGGAAISLEFLTQAFHQPFADLPTSCQDVGRQVRQVRICVEVLRGYLAANKKGLPDQALANYLLQAYTLILTKLGTSYDEIRLAQTSDLPARQALADRLGLDLDPAGADPSRTLLLDPAGQGGQSQPISENALEQLFGLADTTHDPLADGAKLGDPQNQITRWSLDGIAWGRNTDVDGNVYVKISHPQASVAQIDLYRDVKRTDLVASGKGPFAEDIHLTERGGSGLSGRFNLKSAAANQAVWIVAIPRLLSWRLRHLRTIWKQQDWPGDLYAEGRVVAELKQLPPGLQFPASLAGRIQYGEENQLLVFNGVMGTDDRDALLGASTDPTYADAVRRLFRRSQRLPVIDPDLIGPDDFRVPFAKTNNADPDRAFDLWLRRRAWVDARLAELGGLTKEASNKAALDALPEGFQFPAGLQGTIAYEPVYKTLVFTGVMTDADRDLLLAASPDAVYQEAVQELYKASHQPPFDVPDLDAMMALMYEPVAYEGTAVTAWDPVTPVGDLDGLAEKLAAGPDAGDTAEKIQADLNLTVEGFARLLAIREKDRLATVDSLDEPAKQEEWAEVVDILTEARKTSLFPAWYAEERAAGLRFDATAFWIALREPREGAWPPAPAGPGARPLIDPESVKRDELPALPAGLRALGLWESRQLRLSQINQELKAAHEGQGFEAMLRWALGEPGLTDPLPLPPGVTPSTLLNDLGGSDPAKVSAAEATVTSALHLTAKAFTRLMEVAEQAHAAAPDWAEVYLILTTAQKEHREFPTWAEEEQLAGLAVEYWRALKATLPRWRAPAEGRAMWQQSLLARSAAPLVDPDLLITADFRDPFLGQPAFKLKQDRAAWLKQQLDALGGAPASLAGLDTVTVETLIGPDALAGTRAGLKAMREQGSLEGVLELLWGRPLPDLDALLADLTGSPGPTADSARKAVTATLYLTAADFQAFLPLRNKVASNLPLTDAEQDLVDDLLSRVAAVMGVFVLEDERRGGFDISARLDRLDLPADAFAYLRRMRDLLAAEAPVMDSEWDAVRAILVQVRKHRAVAEWKEVERAAGLVLGPDDFQIPPPGPVDFPPKPPPTLPDWRASSGARRDWQDTLQSRVDQSHGVADSFRAAVESAEAASLPLLRDALVLASGVKGVGLDAKASTVTDMLLIDAKNSACQMTTRVAQAIETLLTLLFAVRARQLDASLGLSLHAEDFDEEWQWMGSYATWRAAMFVYLYPENILLPGLLKRQRQTPAFRKLLDDMRGNRRFDPEGACLAAREYAGYFRDVCSLAVEATCRAKARAEAGDCRSADDGQPAYRELFYLFARSTVNKTVYFSTFDLDDATGFAQSFWQSVPASAKLPVVQLIGAVPYEPGDSVRRLYLFGRTNKEGLAFITYDLEKPGWADDWDELELDLPERTLVGSTVANQTISGVILVQRTRTDEPKPPTLVIDAKCQLSTTLSAHVFYIRSLDEAGSTWEKAPKPNANDVQTEFSSEWDAFRAVQAEQNPGYNSTVRCALQVWVKEPFPQGDHYSWMLCLKDDETYESIVLEIHEDGKHLQSWPIQGDFIGAAPSTNDNAAIVTFFTLYGTTAYQQIVAANEADPGPALAHVTGLKQVVPNNGQPSDGSGRQQLVYLLSSTSPGATSAFYRFEFDTNSSDPGPGETWGEVSRTRVAPIVGDAGTASSPSFAFDLNEKLTPAELQVRRATIANWYPQNKAEAQGSDADLTYLKEAYYFVPVQIALQLQRNAHYQEALDWLRTVYDYTAPKVDAKIYYGLTEEHQLPLLSPRAVDWLLDPLDPHGIAAARRDTYTRFTLLSIVRCVLEFAGAEFTRDTAESVPRARTLYLMALKLLERVELKQSLNPCRDVVVSLEDAAAEPQLIKRLQQYLLLLNDVALVSQVTQQLKTALASGAGYAQALDIVSGARASLPPPPRLDAVVAGRAPLAERAHDAILAQPVFASAAGRAGNVIAAEYRRTVERATGLRGAALDQASLPWLWEPAMPGNGMTAMQIKSGKANAGPVSAYFPPLSSQYVPPGHIPAPPYRFCVPANPVPEALRLHAELNLFKIRHCRNIAGLERKLEPYAAPTDAVSGLPLIGAEGQLVLPGLAKLAPTPYRYSVLVERGKHLVGLAQQIEANFLSTLEKADAERYSKLKARQDVRLARAGVRLQNLRVREAESGVTLAELQRDRAQLQVDHFQELLDEGLTTLEELAIAFMVGAAAHHLVAAVASSFMGQAGAGASETAAAQSTVASILSTYAEFERRRQEWEYQKGLAQQDVLIGAQQVKVAQDHVRVVGQERLVAEMQADHAEAVVDFLSNKFTNLELYDWMSDVLEGVYRFFLQQATAVAQLAANQLAFERQEVPPPFIQADYWQAPGDEGVVGDGKAPDRRGLTGSVRLLQDIYQLDQYAFETDKRKLQLTKTISLAQFPAEFQRFRETGVMTVATPMELFDRDFPGHYLRLIRRVRTSVIALIPPSQGIRATLSTTGTSRVVIGGDVFQTVVVNAGPQSVALSSPRDATGLHELDQQPEMRLPFEGLGVDTTWELRLPKAANLFDYRTIADVLLTIEYTALNSFDYRQQVIQTLSPKLTADRAFSFRHQFADQWYDLHNPDQTATPMSVAFITSRDDFPLNLDNLRVQQLALYFARTNGSSFEVPVTALRFKEEGGAGFVGGGATSIDGVISTRKGNAGGWTALMGKSPAGTWELALPNTAETRNRFKNEQIEDILLVITYAGRTAEWPK